LATGWVVLAEAAHIAVLTLTVFLQWTTLLRSGCAGERYLDLAEVDIVGVEDPGRGVGVRVGVPLCFGDSAHNDGFGILSRLDDGAFTEVGLVDGVDETRDTERPLGNGDVERDRSSRGVVGDTEPQTEVCVLKDSAERKRSV
jgi:hypothetical protein